MVEIGLAGAMGAGKTTIANLLVEHHRYHRLSFADPIRYLTRLLVGREIDKKFDRSTMQRVGRSARSPEWAGIDTPLEPARRERVEALARFIFPEATPERTLALHDALYGEGYSYGWGQESYWIRRWRREYLRAPHPVTVDDVRFPVEGEYLKQHGFFVVRLEVSLEERQRRIIQRDGHWDPAWSNDPTEAFCDAIPAHLTTSGEGDPEAIAERIYHAALDWAVRTVGHPVK
ncbi:MAG TPA: hypothetical protein V6D47_00585 [Oscillatoriaceae cyanobacterium]